MAEFGALADGADADLDLARLRVRRRLRHALESCGRARGFLLRDGLRSLGLGRARLARFLGGLLVGRRCRRRSAAGVSVVFGVSAGVFAFCARRRVRRGRGDGAPGGFGRRLLVAGKQIFRAFPRHQEVEAAEILRQRHRLIDDALLGLGIAQLDMAGEREVLALRDSPRSRNR